MNRGITITIIGFVLAIVGYILWYITVEKFHSGIEAIEPFPTIGGWMTIIGLILTIIGAVVFVRTRKK